MPYQQTVTYPDGTTGDQPSLNLDPSIVPMNASIAVLVGNGVTASFGLQYTFDNFDSPTMTDADATWIDSTDIPAATAATKSSIITAPITRYRLVIASLSGGPLVMTALQGMSTN